MSIVPFIFSLFKQKPPAEMTRDQFSRWFSGFADGEGSFQVFLDRNYLRVMFRIRLHIDDIAILYRIQEFLGVGKVQINNNSCVFVISRLEDLKNVLLPLLDQYNLFTTKWLDYLDFKLIVNFLSTASTTRLSEEMAVWVHPLISGMNLGRTEFNYSLIPTITTIDPFWLLGFIEAEGTFGLKNFSPFFQIGQNIRSSMVMVAIIAFLQSLPKRFIFSLNTLPPHVSNSLNTSTSVSAISISSIDALYDYLMFFLLDMPFQTRKGIDFYYWCLILHFHKFGFFYLSEGKALVVRIASYINDGRYSTNPAKGIAPSNDEIINLLNAPLPISLTPEMLHVDLAKAFAKLNTDRNIWVYDNGVLMNSQPFHSFAAAMRSIGYASTSVAARRTIDTGKLVGGRYTFYSSPQNPSN